MHEVSGALWGSPVSRGSHDTSRTGSGRQRSRDAGRLVVAGTAARSTSEHRNARARPVLPGVIAGLGKPARRYPRRRASRHAGRHRIDSRRRWRCTQYDCRYRSRPSHERGAGDHASCRRGARAMFSERGLHRLRGHSGSNEMAARRIASRRSTPRTTYPARTRRVSRHGAG